MRAEEMTLPASVAGRVRLPVAGRPGADLVRCGAELVALCERFYRGMFRLGIIIVGVAAVAALALLPFRQYAAGSGPSAAALCAAGLLVVATPLAFWRAQQLYWVLLRWPTVQLVGVLFAAALVALIGPLNSELWWPSCAILMALATIVSLRRAWVFCLVVLASNLVAHLVAGDLHKVAPVAIIGLWIGYPFWSTVFSVVADRMAAHLVLLNATREARRLPPLRVASWTGAQQESPSAVRDDAADATPDGRAAAVLERLTARQLEVVALLADGLRYSEVAACLSISERQVERHVANAISRLGVRSANQLVAIAVSAGVVPSPN